MAEKQDTTIAEEFIWAAMDFYFQAKLKEFQPLNEFIRLLKLTPTDNGKPAFTTVTYLENRLKEDTEKLTDAFKQARRLMEGL